MDSGRLSFDRSARYWCDFPSLFSMDSTILVEPAREWIEAESMERVPASKLKLHEHFNRKPISQSTWSEVQQNLTNYYKKVAEGNDNCSILSDIPLTAALILQKVRVDNMSGSHNFTKGHYMLY